MEYNNNPNNNQIWSSQNPAGSTQTWTQPNVNNNQTWSSQTRSNQNQQVWSSGTQNPSQTPFGFFSNGSYYQSYDGPSQGNQQVVYSRKSCCELV